MLRSVVAVAIRKGGQAELRLVLGGPRSVWAQSLEILSLPLVLRIRKVRRVASEKLAHLELVAPL